MAWILANRWWEAGEIVTDEDVLDEAREAYGEVNGGFDADNVPVAAITTAKLAAPSANRLYYARSVVAQAIPAETVGWVDIDPYISIPAGTPGGTLSLDFGAESVWTVAGGPPFRVSRWRILVDECTVGCSLQLSAFHYKGQVYLTGAWPIGPGAHSVRAQVMVSSERGLSTGVNFDVGRRELIARLAVR